MRDKILDKAQKLFRLAQKAGTAEESANAMAMASELLAKHGMGIDDISLNEENGDDNFGTPKKEFLEKSKRVIRWKSLLAFHISKEHCCQIWRSPKQGIVILGHEKNIQIVKYLYSSFVRQIDEMTKRNAYGHGGGYVNSYRHGIVDTLGVRLKNSSERVINKEYENHVGNSMALIKIDRAVELRKKLQNEVLAMKPKLKKGTKRNLRNDGYAHGREDGKKIRINDAKGSLSSGRKKIGV